ncbi:MAG: hypothetical protein PHC75_00545 [Burkholderiales bacterium]|nr:hypothetical protein [Burkholderiales bacterium]
MRFNGGFSILEVIIAMSIAILISLAVLKLQYITISNSRQSLVRQKVMIYANSMINQLRVVSQNHNQTYFPFTDNFYTKYSDSSVKCAQSLCSKEEFMYYIINEWKMDMAFDDELSNVNIKAIVCHDSLLHIPTIDSPNCDGNINSSLFLKVIWDIKGDELINKALIMRDNYIVLRVPAK